MLDARMILRQSAEALEMVGGDSGGGFGFEGRLHIVDDEVDLDAAGEAPIAELGKGFGIGIVRGQFMKDPVLESFAVELGARPELAAPGEMVDHADVGEEELRRPDHTSP